MQMRMATAVLALTLASLAAVSTPTAVASVPTEVSGEDLISKKPVSVSLNSKKKTTVLVFLSAVCPCSASHEPVLKKLSEEFSDASFQFVGIHSNSDEDIWVAQEHFKKTGISFPILQDSGAKLADSFGAFKTPHAFVIDPEGKILYQGGVDDSHSALEAKKPFLREAILAVREGRAPAVREARSLGCVIKRP